MTDKLCSMPNCDKPPRSGQRYCKVCHSIYMKAWRAKRRREEQQLRGNVVQLRKRVVDLQRELAEQEASG